MVAGLSALAGWLWRRDRNFKKTLKKEIADENKKLWDTQKTTCNTNIADISEMKRDIKDSKECDKMNLKCHDVILEIWQIDNKGNGKLKDIRRELKQFLIDKAVD
jgi:hypothetical protein